MTSFQEFGIRQGLDNPIAGEMISYQSSPIDVLWIVVRESGYFAWGENFVVVFLYLYFCFLCFCFVINEVVLLLPICFCLCVPLELFFGNIYLLILLVLYLDGVCCSLYITSNCLSIDWNIPPIVVFFKCFVIKLLRNSRHFSTTRSQLISIWLSFIRF